MKAIQYTAFGNSSVLHLNEVDKPALREDEIRVKQKAITVNPFDMKVRSGSMQKMLQIQLPYIPGSDVSGTVEEVGSKVTRFKTGDEVFGTTYGGAYAQYIAVKENQVAIKPVNISAQEAAALAVPIVTAYSVLIETAQLQSGQRLFIVGAGGSVGRALLEMAKALGAYVIGTASGDGVDQIKALGADEVIDYKKNDFSQSVKNIDVVADLVGGDMQTKAFYTLNKGGKLISIVMPPSEELAKKFDVTAQFISSAPSYKKLEFGSELIEKGKIHPQIARTLKLEQAAEAQDLVTSGGVNGKIVLLID